MNISEILVRSPVNRSTSFVVSQDGCKDETPLTRDELSYLVRRLERKHRLMKHALQIKSKAQHKNMIYKLNIGVRQFRTEKEPRIVAEYVRVGNDMQRLLNELSALRTIRRFVAQAEDECKALQAARCEATA